MKIDKTYLEDEHQLKLIVETDQEPFDKAKALAAKEISKEIKVPGFRPGKAPYPVVVRHVGEPQIIERALESFLDEIYPQIIDDLEEEPYGAGKLSEIQSYDPPVFEFIIPLQPEVELGDFHSLRIPYEPERVTDDDVDEIVNNLLQDQSTMQVVDAPAEEGNVVNTKITGFPADSDPENADEHVMSNQPLPVMIKNEDADTKKEWPFPGFSRQLLGASTGDILELVYEFPDDEGTDEDLRGKEILFKVQIEEIRDRVLPELSDELAKKIDDSYENVDELLEDIRENLEFQFDSRNKNSYINQILEAIQEMSTIKFPADMLESEIENEMKELDARLNRQGLGIDTYLQMKDIDEEELRDEIRPEAERRITHGLIIGHLSEVEDLNISTDDVTTRFKKVVNDYFGEEESAEKTSFMNSRESLDLLNRITNQLVTDVTLDYLQALAKGEDTSPYKKPLEEESPDQAEQPAGEVESIPEIDSSQPDTSSPGDEEDLENDQQPAPVSSAAPSDDEQREELPSQEDNQEDILEE